MEETITIQNKNDLLEIKFNKISLFAVINIIFLGNFKHYDFDLIENEYYNQDFQGNSDYENIQKTISELNSKNIISFANFCNLTLLIDKNETTNLVSNLKTLEYPEINSITNKLKTELNLSVTDREPLTTIDLAPNDKKISSEIEIIDINPSFENKILFYYLFPKNKATIETVAEKVELLTMEQKEKIFEKVFCDGKVNNLPQIVKQKTFCVFKLNVSTDEIMELVKNSEINIVSNEFTNTYGTVAPDSIINNNLQEKFFSINTETDNFYRNNKTPYILNTTFRQSVIMTLILNSITY